MNQTPSQGDVCFWEKLQGKVWALTSAQSTSGLQKRQEGLGGLQVVAYGPSIALWNQRPSLFSPQQNHKVKRGYR